MLVSRLLPPELAMHGLLHDAAEAFIGDVASPLKQLLPDYKAIERKVEAAIWRQFGLPEVLDRAVVDADLTLLATERRDLMPTEADNSHWAGLERYAPMKGKIIPMRPGNAAMLFLNRYRLLSRRKARPPRSVMRNSLAAKLCKFFADNPDEELHDVDILHKFNSATGADLMRRLNNAVTKGWLARDPVESGGYSYKRGPNLILLG